jgi:hypothetical protein
LQTNAWKSLPLEQKKKMLEYIRDKRQRKPQSENDSKADDEANSEDKKPAVDPAMAVKSDPYLRMLQQRSLRSSDPVAADEEGGGLPKHPNSAYVAPAQVPHYVQVKPKQRSRWQLAESEFFEEMCACGVKHDTGKKGKKASLMLHTISSMMSTFGDSTQSCVTAVEEVQALGKITWLGGGCYRLMTWWRPLNVVGDHMRKVLGSVNPEVLSASSCLRVR